VSFVSLGCPKALVDSERIITRLRAEGYALTREHKGADLVIVNTCGFLDSAQAESLDAIGEAMAENGKVIVTGCLGKRSELIREAHPGVLSISGPQDYVSVMSAVHTALPGESDFGPNHEIVFLQPLDADASGVPDIDVDGRLVWDSIEYSYVVVTGADGVNVLQRRSNGAAPKTIAKNVERIAFDDNASSGFQIPLDAVRVRIWFRERDSERTLHRYFSEAVVKLRNGVGES